MNEQHIEDIISALYDMIQDARALPLGADKCILERDKVLDMLDEIIAQLPAELKQSRTIVESRNELIGQARREAEGIVRAAQEQARELVSKEAIYQEAVRQCKEMFNKTQERIAQLLITPVFTPGFVETEELSDTQRGAGGFGSTGK
jgi:phosphoenolpyruvate carboxylase